MAAEFKGEVPKDIVKGWNEKRLSNNQVISGLTPFCQLMAIYDKDKIGGMFGEGATELNSVNVFDALQGGNAYNAKNNNDSNENLNNIKKQIKDASFNLYVVENTETSVHFTPQDAIIIGEATSQTNDHSGGVGISDFQIEHGQTNVLGSRTWKMRLTIPDPSILDTSYAYTNLSEIGSEFLILYGWANPKNISGFDATPPPILEPDPSDNTRQMMVVGTGDAGNGGYWSSAKVSLLSYDFSFNEVGQLEVSLAFSDMSTVALLSTRMPLVAPIFNQLIGSADDSENRSFLNYMIAASDGQKVSLKDAVLYEQQRMDQMAKATDKEKVDAATSIMQTMGEGQIVITALGENEQNKSLSEMLQENNDAHDSYSKNTDPASNAADAKEKQANEARGFPYAVGLSTYTKKSVVKPLTNKDGLIDEQNDEKHTSTSDNEDTSSESEETTTEDGDENIEFIDRYEIKSTHIFLGWVLEAIRLSYSETNRSRMAAGEKTYNPKFHYLANSSDSQLNAVFQNKFRRANRSSSIEEKIQEAIIRLKERCLPPTPRLRNSSDSIKGVQQSRFQDGLDKAADGYADAAGYPTSAAAARGRATRGVSVGNPYYRRVDISYEPCLGTPIIEGVQGPNPNLRKLARERFPIPEGAESLVHAPMRGFVFRSGSRWIYKPDWYVQEATEIVEDENGNEIEISKRTGGSPEGFQPDSPSLYKAAAAPAGRGGRFFYQVKYSYEFTDDTSIKMEVILLIDVDEYRRQNKEIWHNTQLRWHGLYVRYLTTYFERVIRNRVNEVLNSGGVLEDIYLEPVDLDFLTSKVFRNFMFMGGKKGPEGDRFKPKPFEDLGVRRIDGDLIEDADKLQNEIPLLLDRKAALLAELNGVTEPTRANMPAPAPQSTPYLRSATLVDEINELKTEIETLCGGRYERLEPQYSGTRGEPASRDAMGNPILSNFKNWKQVIRGAVNTRESGDVVYERRTVKATVYYAIDDYYHNDGTPVVTINWVIWRYYYNNAYEFGNNRIPTNNFQFAKFGPPDEDGEFFDLSNKQNRWIKRNPAEYENAQKRVEENQTLINQKLEIISAKNKQLLAIYREYKGYNDAIKIVDERIASINLKLARYTKFFDDEKNERELSPYDDTSDFDDVLEVNMGRDEPMLLTTKVAQQWYKRFTGIQQSGVVDVYNYGPPKGGKQYYTASNNKKFQYYQAYANMPIKGYPKRVIDPGYAVQFGSDAANAFANLSNGVENLESSSDHYNNKKNTGGVIQHTNWTAFGSPGTPNRDGNNQWGYTYGVPVEEKLVGGAIKRSGGNYVKNYGEFCDLFGLVLNPHIDGSFPKINGAWPAPASGEKDNSGNPLLLYTMIDDDNNIIKPDGNGYYVRTGWKLTDDGPLIYLYPSRATATQIDPSTGLPTGQYGFAGANTKGTGASTDKSNYGSPNQAGDRNFISWNADTHDEPTGSDRRGGPGGGAHSYKWARGENNGLPEGEYRGVPLDFNGIENYGFRIGRNQHCLNFTLDMKRSLVINRPNAKSATWWLGKDTPIPSSFWAGVNSAQPILNPKAPGKINWDVIGSAGSAANGKRAGALYQNAAGQIGYAAGELGAVYTNTIDTTGRCRVVGPTVPYTSPYSNPQYPYGTGAYTLETKEYGSFSYPEKKPNKNYLYIGDFLETLSDYGSGFFTRINNNNYSPTMLLRDGTIVDGEELNIGFVNFIVQNVLAVLPKNRRIMTRQNVAAPVIKEDGENKHRLHDVTYHDLFAPLPGDDEENVSAPVAERSYADLTNFKVDNVADIPIRRDILQNLMNKNNKNMSVMQFIGEVFKPDATDVMTDNVNVAGRQTTDGTFQIYQANKNFKSVAADMTKQADEAIVVNRYPDNFLVFDYRANDSLIENLNMSSKFDPMMGLVFESAALNFTNPENFSKFFGASNGVAMANQLKEFLSEEYRDTASTRNKDVNISSEPNNTDWGSYIEVGTGTVKFDKESLFGKTETKNGQEAKGVDRVVPQSVLSKFITSDPMRLGRMKALIAAERGSSFATQLMSTYMYKASIVIHGTTGLIPGTNILIRGIFKGLEGLYRVVKVREQITPQSFQTFLDLQLLVAGDKEGEGLDDEIKGGMIA